jgi:hypothetical protein
LKLDFVKHKNFIEKCLEGKVCLFTGAGFSLGAKIKGNDIFSTKQLIDSLLKDFCNLNNDEEINRLKVKKNFQQICQYVIYQKTELEFNEYITRKFSNCVPSKFHFEYNKINWKEIYSTNIDDVIEEIYKESNYDLQSINTKRQPDEYTGDNILKYYKLHGDVKNKSEGFIFSKNQYLNVIIDNKFNYPILKFSERLYKDTFCFIGSNFDEVDLEQYISNFQKQNNQELPKEKIYYISHKIYSEDLLIFESKNIIPIEESAESFIQKLLEYQNIHFTDNTIENNSNIKIVSKVTTNKKLEKMGFTIINDNYLDLTKSQIELHKPIDFYLGYSPKWIDIASGADAIFDYTLNIINDIENSNGFMLYPIIGKSGNGKSTALRRILYNFYSNDDYIVVEHQNLNEINYAVVNDLSKLINSEKKHIIFGFDNGSWSYKFIEQIYNKLNENNKVSFIITTRYPEFYRERTYINGLPREIKYIDENIQEENIKKLITVLDKKGYIGQLAKFTTFEEKVKEFLNIKTHNRDLFSSLIYATKGKGFFKRINEHILNAMNESNINIKILFLLAILDKFGSLYLSKSIFYNVFKSEIPNLSVILNSLNDILDKKSQNSDYIKLRGEYATDFILKEIRKYLNIEEIFSLVEKVLMYTSTIYDVDKRKKRSYQTEISSLLLNSKHYRTYLYIKDKSYYDNFYNNLKDYYKDLAPFWLYYAKMEMKLNDLESAWIHLMQAKALNNSYEIEHTIGQWYLINARKIDYYYDAVIDFQKGEEIMLKQINMSLDAYPIHTYIDEYIFFNKKFKNRIDNKKLKILVKMIDDARNKFYDQIIVQIIWKKFYEFLKNINLAELMILSLDDLKLMSRIDLNKNAEHQYLLLNQ